MIAVVPVKQPLLLLPIDEMIGMVEIQHNQLRRLGVIGYEMF